MSDTLDPTKPIVPPGEPSKVTGATVLGLRVLTGEVEEGMVWAILPEGTEIQDMQLHKGLTSKPLAVRVPYEAVVRVCPFCGELQCEHDPVEDDDEPAA